MPQKSPLARVKDEFGGKDKLVEKIVGLLGSGDEPKEELRKRLLGAANSKLIRLFGVASTVKTEHGSTDKLAEATAAALGRSKDKDYVAKLSSFPAARLLDMLRSARRGNGHAGSPAPGAAATGADVAPRAARPKTAATAEAKPEAKAKTKAKASPAAAKSRARKT